MSIIFVHISFNIQPDDHRKCSLQNEKNHQDRCIRVSILQQTFLKIQKRTIFQSRFIET